MKKLGIYIHVPFCKSKCHYCDFCSFPNLIGEAESEYIDALTREICSYRERVREYTVDTVYFGGGTPTLLSIGSFEKIFSALKETFMIDNGAEITAECNPGTVTREYLASLRSLGVNRLSIGVQSAQENELRALGRIHTFERFSETVGDARAVGFDNISADIMLGIPEQTLESLADTVDKICALSPEHISAYGLKIEEGTRFFEMRDSLALPDEETEREMYFSVVDQLKKYGYSGYEISNFAYKGRESAHNLKYWKCDDYIGFGLAAHSCFEGKRYYNTDVMEEYLAAQEPKGIEELSEDDKRTEFVMLGFRLESGIDKEEYFARFGRDFEAEYGEGLARFIAGGYVKKTEKGYRLTREGMYVSNYILSEILPLTI